MTLLHTRSWFSFLSGGSSPEGLVARAAELGYGALGLTDRNGVYGLVRFQKACREHGIRSVVGAEVMLDAAPLVFIARTRNGYANLCRMITIAQMTCRDLPSVTLEQAADCAGDLICLTGGRDGMLHRHLARAARSDALRWIARLHEVFSDRLYVELVHHLRPHDSSFVRRAHELAAEAGVQTVVGGDVRHATREEYRRYDLMTCIRLGWSVFDPHPERPVNAEAHLKSEASLRKLIPHPEAFDNAEAIADACEVDLLPGAVTPPEAELPDQTTAREYLGELCTGALEERYPVERRERARAQLRREMEVICGLGLEEYFLVVREVVAEARRRGIRCAGRGSAANSLVAYLLEITGVDPIEHNLLFERFLHGGRKGTPDIDVDFDSERREEVIDWMERRFGHDHTAMTATLVTYGLRMALRDAAKALGWPMLVVDRLTDAVPHTRPRTVRRFRDRLVEVVGESPLLEVLIEMVEAMEGCPRHLGLHSGGMLLSRRPLYHYTPLQVSANGVAVAQFDKDDVEAMGLIKFDVLGLRMLATVSEAEELIQGLPGMTAGDAPGAVAEATGRVAEATGREPGLSAPNSHPRFPTAAPFPDDAPSSCRPRSLGDPRVFDLIRSGRTVGLFQIESQGQMHLLANHQPETFHDLVVEIALFRPGPLQGNMVRPYIRRRRGQEPVAYDHPDLEPVLRDTYGVILFQEQVLEICHRFAGMPLGEADRFRTLMSKYRDPEEMESMREHFVSGATGRGVDRETADLIFDKVSKFVGYGFCRSHAAAFAMTVYHSAWLKCYHPAAFMAAVMQHRPGMYSLMTLEEEARRFGVPILLPEINRSGVRYTLERNARGVPAIRKPLASIRQVSPEQARAIVLARCDGEFRSVEDLYRRVAIDRDALDALARSGALDALAGSSRRALWEMGVVARRVGEPGVDRPEDLFELPALEELDIPDLPELTSGERLSWDYRTHGAARFHPMILMRRTLNDLEVRSIDTCYRFMRSPRRPPNSPDPILTIAGIATLRQMPPTAKGVMFVTLEDETGYIQCIVMPQVVERFPALMRSSSLIVRGAVQIAGNWRGMVVERAWRLEGTIGGYTGYPSAYGGTDRIDTEVVEGDVDAPATQRREEEPTRTTGARGDAVQDSPRATGHALSADGGTAP